MLSYFINITNCTINLTFWMRNIVRGCCTWKRRSGRRPVKIKFTADMWLQILSTVVCVHWLQLQLGGVKAGRAPIPVIADTGAGTCNIARDIASPTPRHTCHVSHSSCHGHIKQTHNTIQIDTGFNFIVLNQYKIYFIIILRLLIVT